MGYDKKFMLRAMELAALGRGKTNPNPLVGAILVKDGKIVGEGYHRVYGQAHAEVNALQSAGSASQGSELYVTLEPCSHYGKTPPCALAIIRAGVSRVYIGATDPNPLVAGKGIALLREAGIAVQSDLMADEVKRQNETFWHYIQHKTPFVIYKSAASLDGKTATATGESQWISCSQARQLVHQWRAEVMAVLVGVGTALADDPALTARTKQGKVVAEGYRVVMDAFGRTPLTAKLFAQPSKAKTIMVCATTLSQSRQAEYEQLGAKVLKVDTKDGKLSVRQTLAKLGQLGIDALLLEGGANLAASFLQAGAIHKFQLFLAPKLIGGQEARSIFAGAGWQTLQEATDLQIESVTKVGEDLLITAYPKEARGCSQG